MLYAPATSAMPDSEATRGQPEMTRPKMDWPATAAEHQLGVVPTAQLYAELRRRGKPVTPEETVVHIAGLEARIADLCQQRDSACEATRGALAERDWAKARLADFTAGAAANIERGVGQVKQVALRMRTERDEARKLAEHERMLRDMAETRAKEMEERVVGLEDRIGKGQHKLTSQQVRDMAAEKRIRDLEAENSALLGKIAIRTVAELGQALRMSQDSRQKPAAVSEAPSGAAALSRALSFDLANPAAWVEGADEQVFL